MTSSTDTLLPADCAHWEPLLPAHAEHALPPSDAEALTAHLRECPACRQQLQQLRTLLHHLDELPAPAPPPALRANFLQALNQEKAALKGKEPEVAPLMVAHSEKAATGGTVIPLWEASAAGRWLRVAAAVALLAVGTVLGLLLQPAALPEVAIRPAPAPGLAAQLTTLAGQPASANRRLQLVSEAPTTVQPGDAAVQVLITTLNADPNPNVRLAAAEALYHLRADPRVGPALVQALPNQTDPNVQITLIELLVALRDKRALAPLEQLSRQPNVLPVVRQQAQQGLGLLI
ncbi:HEAT repeat domain-containing protein [Hymenobacter sp. 5516J-16]|uniref:HEAT repeat domain-containing protein n=1 Tax=Hymenobacter sp. 5516J-16 TaxID=2932253 RepID=UPI001FD0038F|nr:HEAT repeat domain-containing protein [Hymenobacter sp. 5516J-16]UOQ78577.1 HEAT repeat domain-containing protein [Hymenobacter sp. 5516J-16]